MIIYMQCVLVITILNIITWVILSRLGMNAWTRVLNDNKELSRYVMLTALVPPFMVWITVSYTYNHIQAKKMEKLLRKLINAPEDKSMSEILKDYEESN